MSASLDSGEVSSAFGEKYQVDFLKRTYFPVRNLKLDQQSLDFIENSPLLTAKLLAIRGILGVASDNLAVVQRAGYELYRNLLNGNPANKFIVDAVAAQLADPFPPMAGDFTPEDLEELERFREGVFIQIAGTMVPTAA